MEIFNRWGQIIYTSKDIESGWDGKTSFDGKYILPGIYMYQMNIENLQGELQTIKGHVQVIH
jgi:gliding motility-associated-like protein